MQDLDDPSGFNHRLSKSTSHLATLTNVEIATDWPQGKRFAIVVFALIFSLNLSDYMSRYVVVALFRDLEREWSLNKAQLGALVSIVATAVGFLTVPVALSAERIGKPRGLILMAVLWSLATWASAYAANYEQMVASRIVVGIGESAYSTVGLAVLYLVFPASRRASVSGAFLASAPIGQVLGIWIGGEIGALFGWRAAFAVMAAVGLVLAALFAVLVRRPIEVARTDASTDRPRLFPTIRAVFADHTVALAMLGSALQLFSFAGFLAWATTWLGTAYAWSEAQAARATALFVLGATIGMPVCSAYADRLALSNTRGHATASILFSATTGITFAIGFMLSPGALQLALVGIGVFCTGGAVGPTSAIVARRLSAHLHGIAFSCGAVANNLIGLGPAPWLIGYIADASSLSVALALSSIASLASCVAFAMSMIQSDP